jgi:hypothetical protein
MTVALTSTTESRYWRTLLLYAIPVVLMIAGWTSIHYLHQPHRSPTYRRSVLQCLGYAAWTTPTEGAGPLVVLTVVALHAMPNPETSAWVGPAIGGPIYLVFATVVARVRRNWSAGAHVVLGFGWLLVGAVVFTRLTMK